MQIKLWITPVIGFYLIRLDSISGWRGQTDLDFRDFYMKKLL